MSIDSHLSKHKKPSIKRFPNRFYAHKCSPIEENDRTMRRFETGYRSSGKQWMISDENEFYQR